jgi:hypothetical protein
LYSGLRRTLGVVWTPFEKAPSEAGGFKKGMNRPSMAAEDTLAFAMTVGIEWPLLAWFSGLGLKRTGLFCLFMNGVTWFAAAAILQIWSVPIPALEGGIMAVEAVLMALFWRWPAGKAITASLLLNLSSWLIGERLFQAMVHFL